VLFSLVIALHTPSLGRVHIDIIIMKRGLSSFLRMRRKEDRPMYDAYSPLSHQRTYH
jgi:hypothetical protein